MFFLEACQIWRIEVTSDRWVATAPRRPSDTTGPRNLQPVIVNHTRTYHANSGLGAENRRHRKCRWTRRQVRESGTEIIEQLKQNVEE
jgi:hypothetical protein